MMRQLALPSAFGALRPQALLERLRGLRSVPGLGSRKRVAGDRLAISSDLQQLTWVHADPQGQPLRVGVEALGDDPTELGRRVRALALPTAGVTVLLALPQAQLLQIEMPAVKPEELKSAARWRIKDLVDTRLDELTLDVMPVGDAAAQAQHRQLFVVAARNALIQNLAQRLGAAGLGLEVIEVAEMAQRNLLTLAAQAEGLAGRAVAGLVRHGDQVLLTLCAQGELFYARRLDWTEEGLVPAAPTASALPEDMDGLDFVDYGAEGDASDDGGVPRLVVEVQRSLDVWERSWPNLPVAGLWIDIGDATEMLATSLGRVLDLPVKRLRAERLFPDIATLAPTPALRQAALPLVGALQRFAH